MKRRDFMKLLGVGAVAGPSALACGGSSESTRTIGFDVSRGRECGSVELWGRTRDGREILLGGPGSVFSLDDVAQIQMMGDHSGFPPYSETIIGQVVPFGRLHRFEVEFR